MTGVQKPIGPLAEAARRLAWRLDTRNGLVAMFAAGLLLRLAVAPYTGFYLDLLAYQGWAVRLHDVGLRQFYATGEFADYPPGYLYILWLTAKLSATPGYLLLKLPAIAADLGVGWLAGVFAARLAGYRSVGGWPVRSLVIAGVLFNPAVFGVSAIWGQVDSVPTLFVLGSLLLLFTYPRSLQYEIPALLLFAIAVAIKPQSGLVVPVILYALYRRYLYRRSPMEIFDGGQRIVLMGLLALGLWVLSGLPFGLGPVSLVDFYRDAASVRPYTSLNAFNLWGVAGFWRDDSTGADVMRFAGLSALRIGTLLFVAAIVVVLWRTHRAINRGANEGLALTVAAASVGLLGFALLTRMHERYMFTALMLLAPLVVVRPLRFAYAALSALFVLNLWFPYAGYNLRTPISGLQFEPWFSWIFGSFATDSWQRKVLSLAVTVTVLTVAWFGSQWALTYSALAGERVMRLRPQNHRDTARPSPRGSAVAIATSTGDGNAARWGPAGVVALSCLFGLIVLHGETMKAVNVNDSAFHLQMVRWASDQIDEGRVPLDGWYPYLSLGSSFFHHYQSLPHTLTAYAAQVTGAGDQTVYLWILYLLLALWPISVYCGARLLGWGRWTAAAAAAVSPLVVSASGYGYEHGSYTWRGYGVYSQLWGMWLLPLAWGLTWRAVTRGTLYAAASLALALTMACHFITGYLAVLTVGVWVLAAGAGYVRRALRAALVVGCSLLIASWVLVPLVRDTKWTTQSEFYKGSIFNDSYGAQKILGWLFRGDLFDQGRFPILTLLLAVGIVVCAVQSRTDFRARALLGAFALSLMLFFGRPTLGPVLDVLPGFHDVQIHRFVMGAHLAGILIAGVGLGWLVRMVIALVARLAKALPWTASRRAFVAVGVGVAFIAVVLGPAWTERADYDRYGATLIRQQQVADATDGKNLDRLIAVVKGRADGRVYSGLRSNWGAEYKIGSVPVHAWLADRNVDAIGFTFRTIASLSNDTEANFDETNPADYEMFNVKYLILPVDRKPPVPARLLETSGRHKLWEVQTSGYLQVVDRSGSVRADRTDLGSATRAFMQSDAATRSVYEGVAFAGGAPPAPTFAGTAPPPGAPGRVLAQSADLPNGRFAGLVTANRPAVVLLKASFDPRWTATVDGRTVKPVFMAPSLVGVDVPAGRHEVRLRYDPIEYYPILIAVGILTLVGLAAYPRRIALRSRRRPS